MGLSTSDIVTMALGDSSEVGVTAADPVREEPSALQDFSQDQHTENPEETVGTEEGGPPEVVVSETDVATPENEPLTETIPPPIPSRKIGWAKALAELESRGETELAAHARSIQADATRKAQEAAELRAEAAALRLEYEQKLKALSTPPAQPEAAEELDPWNPESVRRLAAAEAARVLAEERKAADAAASLRRSQEERLAQWEAAHPEFAASEALQEATANVLQDYMARGVRLTLDDAYSLVRARTETPKPTPPAPPAAPQPRPVNPKAAAFARAAGASSAAPAAPPARIAPRKPGGFTPTNDLVKLARG